MSAWSTPSSPPSWGAKTELLAQPDLELLTRPFKVRRLTVRPIGDEANSPYYELYYSPESLLTHRTIGDQHRTSIRNMMLWISGIATEN